VVLRPFYREWPDQGHAHAQAQNGAPRGVHTVWFSAAPHGSAEYRLLRRRVPSERGAPRRLSASRGGAHPRDLNGPAVVDGLPCSAYVWAVGHRERADPPLAN